MGCSVNSKVSVVVPVYNVEALLPRCIESILAQSHNDIEVILVDDGSTDSSGKIINEFADKDSRVKAIHQPNCGVSEARNNGLKYSTGAYITFVDADDYILPDFVANLKLCLDQSDSEVVVGGHIREQAEVLAEPYRFEKRVLERDQFIQLLSYSHWGYAHGKMYKTDFLNKNELKYPAGIGFGEDGIYFENVAAKATRIMMSDKAEYVYHIGMPATGKRKLDYDKEKHTFDESYKAAQNLATSLGDKNVYKCLSVYQHIWRTVLAVYGDDSLSMTDRLKKLRALDFDKKRIYFKSGNKKERFIANLVRNKHWILLDILMKNVIR